VTWAAIGALAARIMMMASSYVAPNDRTVRIAVGYGLEETLTDTVAAQIIADQILPKFRQGDLPGGIQAGADALIARLD
jgi:uncharacterized protein